MMRCDLLRYIGNELLKINFYAKKDIYLYKRPVYPIILNLTS